MLGGTAGQAGAIASAGGQSARKPDAGVDGPAGTADAPAAPGKQNCKWLADCISADGCSTQTCVDACVAQASPSAVTQYSALLTCIMANPQCTTSDCLLTVCTSEAVACLGMDAKADGGALKVDAALAGHDGGIDLARLDALPVDKPDAVLPPQVDVAGDATPIIGEGYTTSGSCDVVVKISNLVDSHTCWDYTLTVTTNHNDGFEHYVAYKASDVSGTQSACTAQTFSAVQPGPWDSAAISASNLSHKQQACTLAGSSYGATAVWTVGGSCSLAGSLGHCSDTATNHWDPSTQVLSSSMTGVWSVP